MRGEASIRPSVGHGDMPQPVGSAERLFFERNDGCTCLNPLDRGKGILKCLEGPDFPAVSGQRGVGEWRAVNALCGLYGRVL